MKHVCYIFIALVLAFISGILCYDIGNFFSAGRKNFLVGELYGYETMQTPKKERKCHNAINFMTGFAINW